MRWRLDTSVGTNERLCRGTALSESNRLPPTLQHRFPVCPLVQVQEEQEPQQQEEVRLLLEQRKLSHAQYEHRA